MQHQQEPQVPLDLTMTQILLSRFFRAKSHGEDDGNDDFLALCGSESGESFLS